jgi:hypothetical protein
MLKADAIRRHLKNILKECNTPTDHDDKKQGFGVEVFQMAIPGERHEQIGEDQ